MFDLTIYPLNLTAGREQQALPGLLVSAAPRKAARMRAQDLLVLSLTLQVTATGSSGGGGPTFSPSQQQEMLRKLAETYFNFSGSVTASLRAVATRLNDFLLSRNLKAAHEGQAKGILTMAVIRGGTLIVGHAGPTHTFLLGKQQVQHFDDSPAAGSGAGRGLGLSRQSLPRFYQIEPEPGDVLLLCAEPPAVWSAPGFGAGPQQHFDLLRRRLLSDASGDLQVAVIRFQPGKGQIGYWHPSERGAAARTHREAPVVPSETVILTQSGVTEPEGNVDSIPVGAHRDAPQVETPQPAAPEPVASEPAASIDPSAIPTDSDGHETESIPSDNAGPSPDPTPIRVYPDATPIDIIQPDASEPVTPDLTGPSAERAHHNAPLPDLNQLAAADTDGNGAGFQYPRPPVESAEPPTPALPQMAVRPGTRAARAASAAGNPAAGIPAAAVPSAARRNKPERAPRAPSGPPPGEILRQQLALSAQRLRAGWGRGQPARARVGGVLATSARRVTPKRIDEAGRLVPFFNFTTGTMLAFAIFVPLVVVAVAMAVYLQAGRSEQYQVIFQQAQQYAIQAAQHTDPALQRQAWTQTYDLVRRAEQLNSTDESRALFQQAQTALDALEGFVRLDYAPAVRPFSREVNITRIVATLNDVYLLDSSVGRILRLYRTATGYELDPKFSCGPGQAGTLIISRLVDMAAMPLANEARATVVGIDSTGNLVYCSPSMSGFIGRALALPDTQWGNIRAMRLAGNKLFVLDPSGNAVYYYDGVNGMFSEKPHLFFDEGIPKMDDVIDLAIDQEFLYLLHADGQMTICEGGGISLVSTRCTDTPYGDPRPGYEPAPLAFEGVNFSQIQATQPPDPSLFTLDGQNHAIYHLSLRRLNLQRQFRPQFTTDFPLPAEPATSFAIAPNRRALIAFGNEVYFAPIP